MNGLYKSGDELVRQIKGTELPDHAVAIWYLGQEGFLFKTRDCTILIDPYLTDSVDQLPGFPPGFWKRRYHSPVQPEALDFLDFVLCTHDHLDHMDPDTIRGIASANPHTQFIVPAPSVTGMEVWMNDCKRIRSARALEDISLGPGVHVVPLAAAHTEFHQNEAGDYTELSYIVHFGDLVVFHGGDMSMHDGLSELLRSFHPDLAFLPINGADYQRTKQGIIGNMGFREAIDLGHFVGADMIVPMHFDLYAVNSENPAYFVDCITRACPGQKYHIFQPGERFIYFSERQAE